MLKYVTAFAANQAALGPINPGLKLCYTNHREQLKRRINQLIAIGSGGMKGLLCAKEETYCLLQLHANKSPEVDYVF